MRSLSDYFLRAAVDPNSTTPIRLPVPDGGRISKVLVCRNGGTTQNATLTFTTARGAITQTVLCPLGGAAGTITVQNFVTNAGADANNHIEEGEELRFASGGGPAAGVTFEIIIVIRR